MSKKEFVIEIDVDGVLIDDIGRAFDRRLIRGGTRASDAFREGVYNLVKLVRGNAAAEELDISVGLIPDTLAYAKEQVSMPYRSVRFRTKNPFSDLNAIRKMLELSGIRDPDVKRYDPSEEKPNLRVQDDTQETWKSSWEGVETLHRGGTHNRILGKISSKVNEGVHFVADLGDGKASRITDQVFSRSEIGRRSMSF